MKRRKTKLLITLGTLIILAGAIYISFPYIFGSTAYPLEYKELIAKYSSQYRLEPNWVAAVIYSESRFNPNASSRVGARGLMQIMPATGRGIANRLGDGATFNADKLYDPETSIRYGCYYLRSLLDSYGNDKTLALIGYNGGGGAISNYRTRSVLPRETTGYIRIVPSAENVYNSVYGQWWLSLPNPPANIVSNPSDSNFVKPERKTLSVNDFWKALLYAGRYNKQE